MWMLCYFSDFAYPTVKDRMPVILTKVVDTVFRKKSQVSVEIGNVSVTLFLIFLTIKILSSCLFI